MSLPFPVLITLIAFFGAIHALIRATRAVLAAFKHVAVGVGRRGSTSPRRVA